MSAHKIYPSYRLQRFKSAGCWYPVKVVCTGRTPPVLGLDVEKVNVNGGAVGLGHPLAATGTRLVLTLAHELKRCGGRYGVATACIGGGQGIAMVIESLN